MFYIDKFIKFMNDNRYIPHMSRYHSETFYDHVYGVVLSCKKSGVRYRPLIIACALHDIAKPRTVVVRPDKGATFYGHEDITVDELAEFLDEDDDDFDEVYNLIKLHMKPYTTKGPEPWATRARQDLLEYENSHGQNAMNMLKLLNNFDEQANHPITYFESEEAKAWLVELYD